MEFAQEQIEELRNYIGLAQEALANVGAMLDEAETDDEEQAQNVVRYARGTYRDPLGKALAK